MPAATDFAARWESAEPVVRRMIAMHIPRAADRDDALQEAALIAWRKWMAYDPARSFAAWLHGIARRCRPAQRREVSLDCFAVAAPSEGQAERVRRALAALPPSDRDLLMEVGDGRRLWDIAAKNRCCTRTITRRLRLARKRLAVELADVAMD